MKYINHVALLTCIHAYFARRVWSKECQPLGIPSLYTDQHQTAHNPSAAWTDSNGWLGVAHHVDKIADASECISPLQGTPLVMYMGKSYGPDPQLVKLSTHDWTVNVSTYDWMSGCVNTTDVSEDCKHASRLAVHVSGYRPYVWNHQVWVTVTVQLYRTDTGKRFRMVQGVAYPNFATRSLELHHVFFNIARRFTKEQPALQDNHERGWGIFEIDGRQLMVYSVFPCLVLLDVVKDNGGTTGYRYSEASCYDRDGGHLAAKVPAMAAAGPGGLHISGHPQIWKDALHVVGHTAQYRNGTFIYNHYVFKIDIVLWRVTHVSKEPVLSSAAYPTGPGAPCPGSLVVGSYHIGLEVPHIRDVMRVVYGHGGKYSCKESIYFDEVEWLELDGSNWSTQHQAADFLLGAQNDNAGNNDQQAGKRAKSKHFSRHN